ncbi:MAG: hypothetical protein EP299_10660, partial [Acidobacteria bacterium]
MRARKASSPQALKPSSPKRRGSPLTILLASVVLLSATFTYAQPTTQPGPLQDVGFDQRLGESVPLDAVFVDERG